MYTDYHRKMPKTIKNRGSPANQALRRQEGFFSIIKDFIGFVLLAISASRMNIMGRVDWTAKSAVIVKEKANLEFSVW